MKRITDYLLMLVMLLALPSCSDEDEPEYINPETIYGEWYMTNIKGWEYDEDVSNGKYEFNETFNFNGAGTPVGDNIENAQKIIISNAGVDSESGIRYLSVTNYYWSLSNRKWIDDEEGVVKFQGDQLIDGTMKVTISKLTDTTMTTYQKDEDGETYITYTRL